MFKRVLVAVDGSEAAAQAARVGVELARLLTAELGFVYVLDVPAVFGGEGAIVGARASALQEDNAKSILARFCSQASVQPAACQFVRSGESVTEILSVATDWHADMIVVATLGRRSVTRFLFGSVAEALSRRAPCPVVVAPAK
jgi:nucleotide-binding universal stress UspA family protein